MRRVSEYVLDEEPTTDYSEFEDEEKVMTSIVAS